MKIIKKFKNIIEIFWWRLIGKINSFIWAIKHRTFWKYNLIKINSLPPGYYDSDVRMLHGMFDLLVDFVEYEKANMLNFYSFPYPKKRGRNREVGLACLDEEIKVPEQAAIATEIKDLYLWWKDVYLKRQDPCEESGYTAFYNLHVKEMFIFVEQSDSTLRMSNNLTQSEKEELSKILDRKVEIILRNEKEEEEMLIRLVKVRLHLWT